MAAKIAIELVHIPLPGVELPALPASVATTASVAPAAAVPVPPKT